MTAIPDGPPPADPTAGLDISRSIDRLTETLDNELDKRRSKPKWYHVTAEGATFILACVTLVLALATWKAALATQSNSDELISITDQIRRAVSELENQNDTTSRVLENNQDTTRLLEAAIRKIDPALIELPSILKIDGCKRREATTEGSFYLIAPRTCNRLLLTVRNNSRRNATITLWAEFKSSRVDDCYATSTPTLAARAEQAIEIPIGQCLPRGPLPEQLEVRIGTSAG